jgi:hypothetical protein
LYGGSNWTFVQRRNCTGDLSLIRFSKIRLS